jgi:hypothetical protein
MSSAENPLNAFVCSNIVVSLLCPG